MCCTLCTEKARQLERSAATATSAAGGAASAAARAAATSARNAASCSRSCRSSPSAAASAAARAPARTSPAVAPAPSAPPPSTPLAASTAPVPAVELAVPFQADSTAAIAAAFAASAAFAAAAASASEPAAVEFHEARSAGLMQPPDGPGIVGKLREILQVGVKHGQPSTAAIRRYPGTLMPSPCPGGPAVSGGTSATADRSASNSAATSRRPVSVAEASADAASIAAASGPAVPLPYGRSAALAAASVWSCLLASCAASAMRREKCQSTRAYSAPSWRRPGGPPYGTAPPAAAAGAGGGYLSTASNAGSAATSAAGCRTTPVWLRPLRHPAVTFAVSATAAVAGLKATGGGGTCSTACHCAKRTHTGSGAPHWLPTLAGASRMNLRSLSTRAYTSARVRSAAMLAANTPMAASWSGYIEARHMWLPSVAARSDARCSVSGWRGQGRSGRGGGACAEGMGAEK
ncbi:hypothetical protein TSOC_002058 [Tetrabaena socialis]|uniref:Uncharacterized protein n=1 Tax=Tetrabaena socialis TaxID=47790 RepID=A0A2J8AF36_9CHLO|nr:hypothetical protein TSOC_002058 [Tetrabaena socialis]|eukprot:PNH11129.1 hypothetical protein TSOC_002058 [Tetrabaena socialis]